MKKLELTEEIVSWIRTAADDPELDVSKLAVFETVLFDTRHLARRSGIFTRAKASRSMLVEMAASMEAGNTNPLHIAHNSHGELPIGRVFKAYVQDFDDGESELRGWFYLSEREDKIVESINNSVVDSVSVAVKSRQMLCSECGFDYLGEEATFDHIFDQTCENGHTIGEDGVYARLVGMESWLETSLVSKGAVSRAKILSRAKSSMNRGTDRLAASISEAAILVSDAIETIEEGSTAKMADVFDGNKLIHDLTTVKSELIVAEKQAELANTARVEMQTKLEAATAELAELQPLKAAAEEVAAVTAFLTEQLQAANKLLGQDSAEVPTTLAGLMDALKASQVDVYKLFPTDGVAEPADGKSVTAKAADGKRDFSAFRVNKNR